MVGAAICLAAMTATIRHASTLMHPLEVVFWRNLFGFLFVLPWVLGGGWAGLRTRRLGAFAARGGIGLVAMVLWFTAIARVPVADVTALSFSSPLFATLGAALFLKERVGPRRWAATVIGFLGAMAVLRPSAGVLAPGTLMALCAAAAMGVNVLVIKSLTRTERATSILFYFGLLLTPASAIPAAWVWSSPPLAAIGWTAVVGAFASAGHFAFYRALALADASAILPLDFTRLIFVALLGYVFFAEVPDIGTWIGGAVIFTATLYNAHREVMAARAPMGVPPSLGDGSV
jgi:drug/metabolite transporter (DMT)-like permease